MVLTIKNFESQNVWPWVTETAPTNLSATAWVWRSFVTWTSATWESWTVWTGEKLVRKEWSAPAWSMDWTVVASISTKNQYQSTWFEDLVLDDNKTYYYKVFAIYDNWTEKWSTAINVTSNAPTTERIEYKIKADSNGIVYAPTGANNTYKWMYSVDGVLINKAEWIWWVNLELKTWLTAWSEHTVIIAPIEETYQWARAYVWYNSWIADLLTQVVYDWSYMWYWVSATDAWNDFRANQYRWCTSLTTAPTEVLPSSVTNIWDKFRSAQYRWCTSLTTAPTEVIPNSVTSIWDNFRQQQYFECTSLTTASTEAISNSVTSIWNSFRKRQYQLCTWLTTAPTEILPNSVTSIWNDFRANQYYHCGWLTTASIEVLPNSVTTIGNEFRSFQYKGCTSLTSAPAEVMSNTVTTIWNSFRLYQYSECILTTVTWIQATPTSVTKGINFRTAQFLNAWNSTTPMTVIINWSNIETGDSNSLSLTNANVLQIKVASSLVTAYKNSADWSNITDSKFVAL